MSHNVRLARNCYEKVSNLGVELLALTGDLAKPSLTDDKQLSDAMLAKVEEARKLLSSVMDDLVFWT